MNAIILSLFLVSLAQIFTPNRNDEKEAILAGLLSGIFTWQMIGGVLGFYVGLCIFAFKAVSTAIRIAILITYDVQDNSSAYYKIFIVETLFLPAFLTFVFYKI